MMVGYVHNSTSMWRIWDPDFKKTIQTSDVEFDEEINCYTTCPPLAVSESDGKAIEATTGLPCDNPSRPALRHHLERHWMVLR
jgi:hypothetical protein